MKFSNILKTEKGQETYNEVENFSELSYPSVSAEATPVSYRFKLCLIIMFVCMLAFAKRDDFFS